MNPYVYNPSYAGVEGHATFFVTYHNQWSNFENPPSFSHASFHVPFKGGAAFGAAAFNIQQGLVNTSAAKITGAYLINIDRTHFVRFGLSLGAGINSVNIDEFDAPTDPAFIDFLDQSSFFIGDFGATYHFGHFNVGVSLPNLFRYNPVSQTEVTSLAFSPTDFVLFKANYRGHLNDDFAIEPHILYRFSNVLPSQIEVNVITHIKHLVWVGAGYRQDAGITALAGAKIKEKIGVGVAYELSNPNISSLLGPSFEINIGYHLGTKKDHAQHVSSFIKSHRLSAEERAKKAEKERLNRLAQLEKINSEKETEKVPITEKPISKNVTKENESDTSENPSSTNNNSQPNYTSKNKETPEVQEEVKPIEKVDEKSPINESEKNDYDGSLTTENDFPTKNESRNDQGDIKEPVSVKRGNNLLELPVGNFVVAGSFKEFEHAEEYSDELFQDGFHDTLVGYSSERGYYYVVVYKSDDVEATRKTRDRFRKQTKLKNAWVLQVAE